MSCPVRQWWAWVVLLLVTGLTIPAALYAESLIQDGNSFEAGLDGWALGLLNGRYTREAASVLLEIDQTTAVHGTRSLRLTQPAGSENGYGVFYKPLALGPGKTYTLSAYLKCAQEGGQIALILGGFPGRDQRGPGARPQPRTQRVFRLTRQWQRYELHIPGLPPSAPAEGSDALSLYYLVITPGATGTTFWIDAVQLDEGERAKPFAADKALEISISTQKPGNLFYVGEAIVPSVQVYLAKAPGTLELECRAVDVLGEVWQASRKAVTVPADGHATVSLESIPVPRRSWLMLEVTASSRGHKEKAYVSAASIQKNAPPVPDQQCQFGFNLNAITSPDNFGADARWHSSNIHLSLDRVFTLATQAGVRWIRMADICRWQRGRTVEIAPGKFLFYDDAVNAVKKYGLAMMGTLGNANARENFCPDFADSGRKSRTASLPTEESWRRYVRTMVSHYKADIKNWEIINEPATAMWAGDYLPLLKAAYEEAKAADPESNVVGICATSDLTGPEPDAFGYIRKVAEGGGLKYVDVMSAHTLCKGLPWQSRGAMPTWDYIPQLFQLLRQYAPEKPIALWNTEGIKYGAFTDRPDIPRTTSEYATLRTNRNTVTTQRLAAAYAVRDSIIEFSGGARVLFLWEFRNSPLNASIAYAGALGLMDWFGFDGTPHAKFVALNALAEKLHGAKPIEHLGLSPRVRCTLFQSPKELFALVWRENQDETDLHSYLLPMENRVRVQNMFGSPMVLETQGGKIQVPINEVPVYVIAPEGMDAAGLSGLVKAAGQQVQFTHDTDLQGASRRNPRSRQRD